MLARWARVISLHMFRYVLLTYVRVQAVLLASSSCMPFVRPAIWQQVRRCRRN